MMASQSLDLSQPGSGPLRRIPALSKAMAALCSLTALLLAPGLVAYWLMTPADALLRDAGLPGLTGSGIGWSTRIAGIAISAAPLACLIWGLMQARRCFSAFAGGRFFTVDAVYGLRGFAIGLFASALLKPLAGAALSVLLSWDAGAGQRALVVSVGSDMLLSLLFAGMVAVITWVMAEARGIADENAQFV